MIGGGNSAGQAAMNFASVARTVTVVVRGAGLSASMSSYLSDRIDEAPNVTVRTHAEVAAVDGDDWLRTVTLRDTRDDVETVSAAHALFICIGGAPHTDWARQANLAVDTGGYLVTGRDLLDPSISGGSGVGPTARSVSPRDVPTRSVRCR